MGIPAGECTQAAKLCTPAGRYTQVVTLGIPAGRYTQAARLDTLAQGCNTQGSWFLLKAVSMHEWSSMSQKSAAVIVGGLRNTQWEALSVVVLLPCYDEMCDSQPKQWVGQSKSPTLRP